MIGILISFCLMQMEQYIFETTGKQVTINPPVTEHEIELFEKMYTWLSNNFDL